MLISELLGQSLNEDDFSGEVEIKDTIDDIIVGLRQRGIFEVGLDDVAGEVSKAVDAVYIDPGEPTFLEHLRATLLNSKWVKEVSDGVVQFKRADEFDKDAGKDVEKTKKKQDTKMSKMAAKRLKKKHDTGEL